MATKGFSSEDVERAFSRACELARDFNDPSQQVQRFFALQGVWGFHFTRSNTVSALRVADESMAQARTANDGAQLKIAHYALGASLVHGGRLRAPGAIICEGALAFKDISAFIDGIDRFGPDPNVLCLPA